MLWRVGLFTCLVGWDKMSTICLLLFLWTSTVKMHFRVLKINTSHTVGYDSPGLKQFKLTRSAESKNEIDVFMKWLFNLKYWHNSQTYFDFRVTNLFVCAGPLLLIRVELAQVSCYYITSRGPPHVGCCYITSRGPPHVGCCYITSRGPPHVGCCYITSRGPPHVGCCYITSRGPPHVGCC